MKKLVVLFGFVLCGLAVATPGMGQDSAPSCAVLAIKAGAGVEARIAVDATTAIEDRLAESGHFVVLPAAETQRQLKARGAATQYPSDLARGVAAGRLLKSDFVLYGEIQKSDAGFTLVGVLVDVKLGGPVRGGKTGPVPTEKALLTKAVSSNLAYLLGSDTPAAKPAPAKVAPTPVKPPVAAKPIEVIPPVAVAPTPEPMPEPEPAPVAKPPVAPPVEAPAPKPIVRARLPEPRFEPVEKPMPVVLAEEPGAGLGDFLTGRLVLGTRLTQYTLTEDSKDSFIGTINQLDAVQDSAPTKLFADWFFLPWVGVDLTWDKVQAETWTRDSEESPTHTDGDFVLSGPILSVIGRYPNSTLVTPYGGAGVALLSGSYEEEPWWHLGYPSQEEYEHQGSPATAAPTPKGSYTRNFDVGDSTGYVLFGGIQIAIWNGISADLFVRYMSVDTDVEYYLKYADTMERDKVYSIPMSNYAYGLGLAYAF